MRIGYNYNGSELTLEREDFFFCYNDEIIDLKFIKPNSRFPFVNSDIIPIITNSNMMRLFDKEKKKMGFELLHSDITLAMDTFGPFVLTAGKDKKIILILVNGLVGNKHIATFTAHTE